MSEKKNDLFTIAIVAAILMIFSTTDLLTKLGILEKDNITEPELELSLSKDDLWNGRFFEKYEEWEQETFFNRTKWSEIVRNTRLTLGRRELNGIYLGKRGRYFEKHAGEDYPLNVMERALEDLKEISEERNALIMLIPTSDEVWKEDLPGYADSFDQSAFLGRVRDTVGEEAFIDLYASLKAHEGERLYYSTDPHWTSLGAYYGYLTWRRQAGNKLPVYYDPGKLVSVKEDFVGKYAEKTGLEMQEESILTFGETYRRSLSVLVDGEESPEEFYHDEKLDSAEPLEYFLGNDFRVAEITTGRDRKESLVVIGDSYANSMLPLLAPHYRKIYVIYAESFGADWKRALGMFEGREDLEYLLLQSVPDYLELYRQ